MDGMCGLVELRRGMALLIGLAVGIAWSSAFACPRADACPDVAKEARRSCCGGDGQGDSAPATKHECPGDCCRPAPDLPVENGASLLPAPTFSVATVLPSSSACSAPRETVLARGTNADSPGPPLPSAPAFLLGSGFLI